MFLIAAVWKEIKITRRWRGAAALKTHYNAVIAWWDWILSAIPEIKNISMQNRFTKWGLGRFVFRAPQKNHENGIFVG